MIQGYKNSFLDETHLEKIISHIISISYQSFLFSPEGGEVLCADRIGKKGDYSPDLPLSGENQGGTPWVIAPKES